MIPGHLGASRCSTTNDAPAPHLPGSRYGAWGSEGPPAVILAAVALIISAALASGLGNVVVCLAVCASFARARISGPTLRPSFAG